MSAQSQVQKAIAVKLKGDGTLTALVTGVFDFRGIPVGQTFPYVTIGDGTETDDSVFSDIGYELTCTLHIWSRQPGTKEAQTILARLNALLNHQSLILDSQKQLGTWYDFSQILGDPDDTRITHVPVRYRIKAQE